MYAFPTRLRPPVARARKDDPMLTADPAAAVAADPAAMTVVENVTAVEPVKKRWRAIVTRNVVETAVVEFDAFEDEDQYTLAEALLPSIPPEAWSETPEAGWGYIDRIEEVAAAVTDPAATPAETLARQRRSRFMRKGLFDITAADGTYYGSFEAPTADEAIAAYVLSLGYATADEAAVALGFATADEFIASLVVTEAPAADPAADPAAAPEVMSFKTAGDVTAAVEQIGADAEATLAALDMADATAVATAIDYLISLRDQLDVALATGLTGEPDAALAQEAMDAANELWTWLDEQIDVLQGDIAADPALAA